MRLIRMVAENFLSFGPEQKINFVKHRGLVFVEGANKDDSIASSNGSGKSALLEAIVWGLFGRTLRGLKGDDVINNQVKKDCRVVLIGEELGAQWDITRFRKYEGSTGLTFTWGGKSRTTPDVNETQKAIEEALNLNYDIFINATIFGQGNRWRFTELSDTDKKALFDKLLSLDQLSTACDLAKDGLKEAKSKVETLERDQVQYRYEITAKAVLIDQYNSQVQAEYERNKQDLKNRIADLKSICQAYKETELDLKKLQVEYDDLKEQKTQKEAERLGLEEAEVEELQAKLAKYRAEQEQIETQISKYAGRIVRTTKLGGGDICDLCGQKITNDHLASHTEKLKIEKEDYQHKLEAVKQNLDMDTIKFNKLKQKCFRLKTEADQMVIQLDKLMAKIVKLKGDKERAKRDRAELESLENKLYVLVPLIDKDYYQKLQKDLKAVEVKLSESKNQLEKLQFTVEQYQFWATGFGNGGIKSYLLDFVVPLLNQRAEKFSKSIMGGLKIEFGSQTQLKSGEMRDKFDVSVYNRHGSDLYIGNSGGEKRKIDIVVARTLQSLEMDRVKSACNISFWDEVFESLDESSCEAVMSMLNDEIKSKDAVFVISHLDWLKSYFPSILRVTKDKFSSVEWQ